MRMRKIPSEMELAPRYKLLIHCLHYLHCLQCLHCTPLNCLSCLHFFSLFLLSDSGQMPGRLNLPSNCPAGKQNNQQSILTILKTMRLTHLLTFALQSREFSADCVSRAGRIFPTFFLANFFSEMV